MMPHPHQRRGANAPDTWRRISRTTPSGCTFNEAGARTPRIPGGSQGAQGEIDRPSMRPGRERPGYTDRVDKTFFADLLQ